ncbi:MAG: outer membrane lipoprotein carrier protein LolA [bacterium]
MKKRIYIIPLMALILRSDGYGINAEQVISKSKEKYNNALTFKINYKCVLDWKISDKIEKTWGILFFKKPENYYLKTKSLILCTNGQTFWQYSKNNRQVVIRDLIDADAAFKIDEIFFNYDENFSPDSFFYKNGIYNISMVPKNKSSQIIRMDISVNPKTWLPLKINIKDNNENETLYIITDFILDSDIPDNFFEFKIPDGVDVEDLRE